MPEHFGLEQRLGERSAIHRNQRPARSATLAVNELRDHFFAAAALAGDEDRCICRGDAPRQGDRLAEGGRRAHADSFVRSDRGAGAERLRLAPHVDRMRGPAHQHLQLAPSERLWQVIPRAGAQRLKRGFDRWFAGNHDDDRVRIRVARRAQQLHARRPAHVQVDQDDIERATLQSLERFFPAATYVDLVPFEPERRRTTVAQRVFVIDHKNPHARLHRMVQRKEVRHVASVKRHRGASGSGGRR